MKLQRNVFSLGIVSLALVTGLALAPHTAAKTQKLKLSDSTTTTQATTDPLQSDSASDGTTDTTTPSDTQSTSTTPQSQSSGAIQSGDSAAQSQTADTNDTPATPVVTPVSATFEWGAPQPGSNGQTIQQGSCTYTYSDGSTQVVADGTMYTSPAQGATQGTAISEGPGCDVSIAPTGN
jgi:hypothetical protein